MIKKLKCKSGIQLDNKDLRILPKHIIRELQELYLLIQSLIKILFQTLKDG